MEKLKEKILNYLQRKNKKEVKLKKLIKILNLQKENKNKIIEILKELEKKGTLKLIENKKIIITQNKIIEGKIEVKQGGFGFLIVDKGKDIFIPKRFLKGARDGDYVKVVITKFKEKGPEGKVLEILKKSLRRFSGTLWKRYRDNFIEPDQDFLPKKIYPLESVEEIPSGNKVGFILINGNKAKGIKNLGNPLDPETPFNLIKYIYNLPEDYKEKYFDEEVLKRKIREEIKRRKDLRDLVTFTIDPYNAKDFDDAISAFKNKDGYELFVHIADVSFFVPMNSRIFREVYTRGTSYYLLDKVIHMLPKELSEKFCSLQPGKIRLAKTVHIILDFKGNVKKFEIYNSIIKSNKRLNYEEAQDIIDGKIKIKEKEIYNSLKIAEEISKILKERRRKRFSLDFDLPEPEILFTEEGKVKLIQLEKAVFTHSLIEECMILANRMIAKFFAKKNLPFIYRIHEEPDNKKLEELKKILSKLLKEEKLKKILLKDELTSHDLFEIIEGIKGKREELIVIKSILKAMKQAKYSVENKGHYGLKLNFYTHFTSPIRRLADLIVHNLLNFVMENKMNKYPDEEELRDIAERASETERTAQKAEWDIVDMKILEHLKGRIGERGEGFVTNIKSDGFFVYVPEFYFEGFVSMDSLPFRATFNVEEKRIYLKNRKKIDIGDNLNVFINRVDIYGKKLILNLA
ncbi:MAG: VacB/RNase II family 3'-5' exoribonuclease [candidate division WOR-3 bacterium]